MAGRVTTKKCRATGYKVTVARADDLDLCSEGGKWVTVCEEHGSICNHDTRKLADEHAAWPAWCEECQPKLDAYAEYPCQLRTLRVLGRR